MQTLGSCMVLGGILALLSLIVIVPEFDLERYQVGLVCGCTGVSLVGLVLSIVGRHRGHPV